MTCLIVVVVWIALGAFGAWGWYNEFGTLNLAALLCAFLFGPMTGLIWGGSQIIVFKK